jgi:hypothetical protein
MILALPPFERRAMVRLPRGESPRRFGTRRIRLAVQDAALSRRKHGFESRMRYHLSVLCPTSSTP